MKAQNQNQAVDNDEKKQEYSHTQFVLPDECKKLRGCNKCGLLKTKSQWDRKHACENCGIFQRQQTNENTGKTYFGIIGIIDPKGSFIRKKAKIFSKNGQKLKSGIYGI